MRVRRALDVVGRDDAGVVAGAGRVVLLRLARIPLLRQADVRVRRADHRERAWMRRLRIGTMIFAQPELNVPTTPITDLLLA